MTEPFRYIIGASLKPRQVCGRCGYPRVGWVRHEAYMLFRADELAAWEAVEAEREAARRAGTDELSLRRRAREARRGQDTG
jgi:hypothetical protein